MMKIFVIALAMLSLSTSSVAGNKGLMGALLGAGVGAGVGHAVDRTGGSGKGAIIGAIGGYVIGNQMDKSEQRAAQAPVEPAQQTTRQGASVHASGYNNGDCASSDNYVDRAAKSSNNDDRVYYLEKAVKLCPYQARAHNDLGVAYYQRNQRHDRDRAKSEFNEALKIDPGYTVARNNLNNL
jgi:Flp pilus assembly protein TadD